MRISSKDHRKKWISSEDGIKVQILSRDNRGEKGGGAVELSQRTAEKMLISTKDCKKKTTIDRGGKKPPKDKKGSP